MTYPVNEGIVKKIKTTPKEKISFYLSGQLLTIALLLEKNPALTRVEVENILKNSSDKIGNLPYEDGRNDYYGYGKINLSKIMSY